MRRLLAAVVASPLGIVYGMVLMCLSTIRGFIRKLFRWRKPGREPEKDTHAPESPQSDRPASQVGSVRAAMRPRGLVEVDDLVESAWWDSKEPSPARDSLVSVERAVDGVGWLARPLPDPSAVYEPPGKTRGTAPP